MNEKPLVSCIIIFFNAEQFFVEAIESVLAQTYDNWELLLVDDGSSDNSTEIALKYVKVYPGKICYLEHEGHLNRGMSTTRNLGIRHAKGEYISFLDADDVWLPSKLEEQVAIMEAYPEAGMVYGKALYWYSWSGKPDDVKLDFIDQKVLAINMLFQPKQLILNNYPFGKASAPCPSDLLLRKKNVIQVSGFEEVFLNEYQLYEDQAFLSKIYLNATIYISDKTWLKYRIHFNSCSSKTAEANEYKKIRLFFLNWFKNYLLKQNIKNVSIWLALIRSYTQIYIQSKH